MGFLSLNVVRSFPQGIPPKINQLIQQASTETDTARKKQLLIEADRKTNDLLSNDVKNAWLWFGKGVISEMLGQNNFARDSHRQAVENDTNVPEFHLHLGISYYKLDTVNEALTSFQQAVQKGIAKKDKSVQADAWYWQGKIHHTRDDTADARLACSLALELRPNHIEARELLSEINRASWYEKGRQAIEKADLVGAKSYFGRIPPNYRDVRDKLNLVNKKIRTLARLDSTYKSAEEAERSEDLKTAHELYEDILVIEPKYKDVSQRLEIVRSRLKTETEVKKVSEPSAKTDIPRELKEATPIIIKSTLDTSHTEIARGQPETADSTQIALVNTTNRDSIQVGESDSTFPIIMKIMLVLAIVFATSFVLFHKYRSRQEPRVSDSTQTVLVQTGLSNELPRGGNTVIDKRAVPHKVDRYRIREELGEGAMGVVHRATDTKLNDRVVAIKFLKLDTRDPREMANRTLRFDRAWRILAKLDHPNIVSLIDYDRLRKNEIFKFYMVMEYVDGVSVDKMLEKNGRIDFGKTLHIIRQVLSALEYAHRSQVVHRDLKPANIMVHKEGWVKVLDFDIAKIIGGRDSQSLTMGGRIGTPSYMSTEQLHGGEVDHRTDIFSLGLIFYEMLAGYLPDKEIRYGTKSPDLEKIRSDIPDGLDDIIAKMLVMNADDRYQSAKEILDRLELLGST
jgi:tetratricopeptide (TPR) repeat protein